MSKKATTKAITPKAAVTKNQSILIDKHIGDKQPQHMVHAVAEHLPNVKPIEILSALQQMQAKTAFFQEILDAVILANDKELDAKSAD